MVDEIENVIERRGNVYRRIFKDREGGLIKVDHACFVSRMNAVVARILSVEILRAVEGLVGVADVMTEISHRRFRLDHVSASKLCCQ